MGLKLCGEDLCKARPRELTGHEHYVDMFRRISSSTIILIDSGILESNSLGICRSTLYVAWIRVRHEVIG